MRLLSLPAGLLTLALAQCADAQQLQWPYNLPRTLKYYPEDEVHAKRGLEAQERLAWQAPTAMKKMGEDPSEKFFLDYWEFDTMPLTEDKSNDSTRLGRPAVLESSTNASSTYMLLAPLAFHANSQRVPDAALFGRGLFARDFQCPADTVSCSNIGSDLCCRSGETCVNTSGGVGCCPAGATCGDTVSGCDTAAGYTSCPNSSNGGCCVPGAACLGSGCVIYGTQTVSVTLSTATITNGGTINPTTMTRSGEGPGSTIVVTSAYTQTVTEGGTTVTQTVISPVTITAQPSCSGGFFSCPASLGGGCCPNGQGCASGNSCPNTSTSGVSTSTTAVAVPPVRPTTSAPSSDSQITPADTNVPESTQATAGACPPYYYMCSARYLGGCCRVDRNCDTTSCPPTVTSDFVTSGITIGIAQAPTGACMTSWQSCNVNVGGGCCPPGYACGTNCVASGGTQTTAKQAPSSGGGAVIGVNRVGWSFVCLGMGAAFGMIIL